MHIIRYFTLIILLVSCGLSAMNNNPKVLAVRNAGSYEAYLAAQIPALQNYPHIKNKIQKYINIGEDEKKTKYKDHQELKKEVADAAHYLNPDLSLYCGTVTGTILLSMLMEYTYHKPDPIGGICIGVATGIIASGIILLEDLLIDENTRNTLNVIRKHPSLYLKTNNKFSPHSFDFRSGFTASGMAVGLGRILWLNEFPFTLNFPFLHK